MAKMLVSFSKLIATTNIRTTALSTYYRASSFTTSVRTFQKDGGEGSGQKDEDIIVDLKPPLRPDESLENKKKRLLWESRKRGILENDLILSKFAAKYLQKLTIEELAVYDDLLDENDWDIYYWSTGKKPAPEKYDSIMKYVSEIAENRERVIMKQPELFE